MNPEDIKGLSLSIYHFNLQYNAGNLESYHVLIKKSFVPFLDFYMNNPDFKASCEIQGHAIAFMARFYPDELAKLVELVMDREQIELVSVHYSDQVYLAYPRRDLEESIKVNDETLARYGLSRGGTWFAQENFFGPGAVSVMKKNGYKVALLNRHYLRHYRGDGLPKVPYYERDGIYFLAGGGFNARDKENTREKYKDVPELVFDYWGDGELAFTRGNNYFPFHGPSEKKRLKRLYLYTKRHKDGYLTEFCTKYVEMLREMGVKPEPLPLVLDGTWNYPIYGGVYLWMGRYRLWWEKDGYVRSHTFETRKKLLGVEILLQQVNEIPWEITKKLRMAWRHLLLAEVSDSTGQTPVITEVKYSFSESNLARKYIDEILPWVKEKLGVIGGKKILVNTMEKSIHQVGDQEILAYVQDESGTPSNFDAFRDRFPGVEITASNMKKANFSFRKPVIFNEVEDFRKDLDEMYFYIDFKGRPSRFIPRLLSFFRQNNNFKFHEKYDRTWANYVGFTVPLLEDRLIFSPALMEDILFENDLSEFNINETLGKTFLPLPSGLIGLGNEVYLLKHNDYFNTHIAATVDFKNKQVGFLQDCPPSQLKSRWKFSFVKGPKDAVIKRANQLNVFPRVLL